MDWRSFGSTLLGIGSVAAAPFSGGLSLALGAGAGLLGSLGQQHAQGQATQQLVQGGQDAQNIQTGIYNQTRADLAPITGAASQGLNYLAGINPNIDPLTQADVGSWMSPAVDFMLGEGVQAIDRSAASRGNLFSGGTGRQLMRYGTGLASQEYGNAFNRAASQQALQAGNLQRQIQIGGTMTDAGLTGLSLQTGAGTSYGRNMSDLATGIGSARAAGTIGQSNTRAQMVNNLVTLGGAIGAGRRVSPGIATPPMAGTLPGTNIGMPPPPPTNLNWLSGTGGRY